MAGLEDLYREIILDHYRSPRNRGELDTPPATRTEGFNRIIKNTKRVACGFRNLENYQRRILSTIALTRARRDAA